MNQVLRIGGVPLMVQVLEFPAHVVGRWIGTAPDAVREVAREALSEMLARPAERFVLDLGRLREASTAVTSALAAGITEAQRVGREVWLVRCSAELFRALQQAGMSGAVSHAGSLVAATQGLAGETTGTLDLHIRSSPELLHRLRSVVSVMARQAGLPESTEIQIKMAVTEAAANAIVHGSPEGPRNHVRVSFHLDPGTLIVDVADQGPGFDPGGQQAPAPADLQEHGYGLELMRQTMDRIEFYRDDRGMLVRMTKLLEGERTGLTP